MAHILFIDDDEILQQLYSEILKEEGHSVTIASDGQQALALLNAQVHLVITDLNMPRLSGLELLRQLRERSPGTPIIIATGQASQPEELRRFVKEHSGTGLLFKPFQPLELCDAVEQALRH